MRATSKWIVRADDADSATDFITAEHRYWTEYEQKILGEFHAELQRGDLTQDQMDAIELFADTVRERRTSFNSHIAARKARAAGLIGK